MLKKTDIQSAKFEVKRGRYDCAEVDQYLRIVADGVEELNNAVEAANRQLEDYKEKEASLSKALINAENTAQKIIEQANVRASVIAEDAQEKAKAEIANADAYVAQTRQEVQQEVNEVRGTLEQEKALLIEQTRQIRMFKEEYVRAIEHDIQILRDKMHKLLSDSVWNNDRPQEVADPVETQQETQEAPATAPEAAAAVDLDEILKDLPETDADLKKMIDDLMQ